MQTVRIAVINYGLAITVSMLVQGLDYFVEIILHLLKLKGHCQVLLV